MLQSQPVRGFMSVQRAMQGDVNANSSEYYLRQEAHLLDLLQVIM